MRLRALLYNRDMTFHTTDSYRARTATPEQTKALGAALAPALRAGDVVLLTGDLGAGKTQFVQGVAAALGIDDAVVSPTFNIVLSYEGGRLPLYHFDLYRLDDASELDDIDFYGIVEGDGASFIEWGDRFDDLVDDGMAVAFSVEADGARMLAVRPLGPRGAELAQAWSDAAVEMHGAGGSDTARESYGADDPDAADGLHGADDPNVAGEPRGTDDSDDLSTAEKLHVEGGSHAAPSSRAE